HPALVRHPLLIMYAVHDSFMALRPPRSTLFPYTTLFRSNTLLRNFAIFVQTYLENVPKPMQAPSDHLRSTLVSTSQVGHEGACIDRKSTRLNSSHVKISYAVFCLKKKNENPEYTDPLHIQ